MVKLNKIYTRTGDEGTTGLVNGARVSKADVRIIACGAVDEVNAALGVALSALDGGALYDVLRGIQNDLFDLGADLATPGPDGEYTHTPLRIVPAQTKALEGHIDRLNADLSPLTSFILPGGTAAAAQLHMARTICRRAESACVSLHEAAPLNPHALIYLNRLSDLLFVAARHVNAKSEGDVLWVPGKGRN